MLLSHFDLQEGKVVFEEYSRHSVTSRRMINRPILEQIEDIRKSLLDPIFILNNNNNKFIYIAP